MKILIGTHTHELQELIKETLKRFPYDLEFTSDGLDIFQKAITRKYDLMIMEYHLLRMDAVEILRRMGALENFRHPPVICLTGSECERDEVEREYFTQTEVVAKPIAIREFVDKIQQILHQQIEVACLGGGTGLFTLLSGLKTISGIRLSSIVSTSDDGGSTGKLRDMFGVLPPGDIRRSLVALSTAPDLINELIQYRFERGGAFAGHNFGNILLTALSEMRGSMFKAVRSLSEILNIQGEVIPVTEENNRLKAELENGQILEGEHKIDLFEGHDVNLRIKKIWMEPSASALPDALEAIWNAKLILIGPGDLFTSIIPNLLVRGIAEAIQSSRAKKVYICNVMTKPGETTGFQVSDHVRELIKYLQKDCLDYVVCSNTRFSQQSVDLYAHKNQIPVVEHHEDILRGLTRAEFVWADIASETELVRHDSLKLAVTVKTILSQCI